MSKSSCSTIITAHERKSFSSYGTQSVRLGRDSQQCFGKCNICMSQFKNPVSCLRGHIFCRDCIYESLLAETEEYKKNVSQWKQHIKVLKKQLEEDLMKEQQKKIDSFTKQESLLSPSIGDTENEIREHRGDKNVTTPFWLPTEAPSAKRAKISSPKPQLKTHCPNGHELTIRQLINIKFTVSGTKGEEVADTDVSQYICPTCYKNLSSISKVVLLKACGHALCYLCQDEFLKSAKACPVCNEPCKEPEDIITLQSPGSGFASRGSTVVKKDTPVARIV
ncbi:uncharacterized protein LOC126315407 [Schistocerca gregaria]|uniref:uncharacterized protein LOC126315407 n=1 Tax=Schistocerca gregaria TaxID=7010 RepID=UPI00211DF8EC|nr:uncharacterized protein LOC126315407 [Schistocerca gregaria]